MRLRLLFACGTFCFSMNPGFSRTFTHPGALVSLEQLQTVREHLLRKEFPWTQELETLRNSKFAIQGPMGKSTVNSVTEDAAESQRNATAAYAQALLWYYTGDESYAKSAVAILNSWSALQAFTAGTEQDRLQAGWIGSSFAAAAEILRLYPQWPEAEREQLRAMFRRAFYPQLNTASFWNGNVDLTQIEAMLSIAVFNEDEQEFNLGLERLRRRTPAYFYLKKDGPLPAGIEGDKGDIAAFWHHPLRWEDGLMQETCRDNGHHAQFGLGTALHAAEIAWHQGVDVYSEFGDRFASAMELLAGQFLSGSMQGLTKNDLTVPERFNTWEIGFAHYHGLKGNPLPLTERLLREQIRPKSERASCNLNFETLTHGTELGIDAK